jgi:hypothetical protein
VEEERGALETEVVTEPGQRGGGGGHAENRGDDGARAVRGGGPRRPADYRWWWQRRAQGEGVGRFSSTCVEELGNSGRR